MKRFNVMILIMAMLAMATIPGCALFQKQDPDIWKQKVVAATDALESAVKALPDDENRAKILTAVAEFRARTAVENPTYNQLDTLFDAAEIYIATMPDGKDRQDAQLAIAAARMIIALSQADAPPT